MSPNCDTGLDKGTSEYQGLHVYMLTNTYMQKMFKSLMFLTLFIFNLSYALHNLNGRTDVVKILKKRLEFNRKQIWNDNVNEKRNIEIYILEFYCKRVD